MGRGHVMSGRLHCDIHRLTWEYERPIICPLCRLEGAEQQVERLNADLDAARQAIRDGYEAAFKAREELKAAVRECLPDLEHYARTHGPGPDRRLEALKKKLAS